MRTAVLKLNASFFISYNNQASAIPSLYFTASKQLQKVYHFLSPVAICQSFNKSQFSYIFTKLKIDEKWSSAFPY